MSKEMTIMANVFQNVRSKMQTRSTFDLSHAKRFTGDMGLIYPVQCDEVIPGDVFKMGTEVVIRMQPMVAPVLHKIVASTYTFFVPYRLLWDQWEEFITGGEDGNNADVIPTWVPSDKSVGSLWDSFGFPIGVNPVGSYPIQFPLNSYNAIYNEYFRDQNIISEVALTDENLKRAAWQKDYFTSALPWQQRGTPPALPISGTTNAYWDPAVGFSASTAAFPLQVKSTGNDNTIYTGTGNGPDNVVNVLDQNTVDFADAATFNVSDLRLAFQIQKWQERNARSGARYIESLKSHFGIAPRDERLDRPEFIGGTKNTIIVSEVLQTGETGTTPQGNMAGHGLTYGGSKVGTYRVKEHGLIMTVMTVRPKGSYSQGINKQWLRESRYDFYWPEFANLSEQPVKQAEIYTTGIEAQNDTIFGYQGRYSEMRYKQDINCGQFGYNQPYNYWHLGREFSSAPTLSQAFIECNPRKDFLAAPSEPAMLIQVGNIIKAARPMPYEPEPGFIDH
jgi:hypothetical protein